MRNAISYTNALHELLRAQDVIFVDCVRPLAKFPKSLILQHDGFHLSPKGHNVIGEAIAQAIVADVRARENRTMDAGPDVVERLLSRMWLSGC
jgi:lysophospholipase L1-like esterase